MDDHLSASIGSADSWWISVATLADEFALPPLLDSDGRIVEPFLAVDLDGAVGVDADVVARAVAGARGADRIVVGVARDAVGAGLGELVGELDVVLTSVGGVVEREFVGVGDPGGLVGREFVGVGDLRVAVGRLREAVMANPQAALVLKRLLRDTRDLDVVTAIDVESLAYSTLLGGTEFRRWLAGRARRAVPVDVDQPVVVVREAGELRITLNRPERRNAYGRQLRDALVEALWLADVDESVVRVVVDGAGPAFCAGGDLDEFGTTPDLATAHFVRTRGGAGRLMHRLADRLEVRVHGACVGAGIELPAFAGRIVARPDATFRLPEVGMGLIPGAGGTVSIPRRIGRWRTLFLALSGETLDTRVALEWGLVDEVEVGGGARI